MYGRTKCSIGAVRCIRVRDEYARTREDTHWYIRNITYHEACGNIRVVESAHGHKNLNIDALSLRLLAQLDQMGAAVLAHSRWH